MAILGFPPKSLNYLLDKLRKQLRCTVLTSQYFSFLRAFIKIYATEKESGKYGKNWKEQAVKKFMILSNIDNIAIKYFSKIFYLFN